MSMKRYAVISAISNHNHNKQQNLSVALASTTATIITATAATAALTSPAAKAMTSAQQPPIDSASGSSSNGATAYQSNLSSGGAQSGSTSLTTYYSGGLGLFHQQNHLRGGTGLLNGLGGTNASGGVGGGSNYANVVNGNVNLLLGGAMLSLVTTILCVVCYCCHRNIKKRTEAAYRQQRQWMEGGDPNMEVYSVEQCYETAGLFLGDSTDGLATTIPTLHHEPPPSYDAVVLHEQQLLQQQQQQHELQQQQQQEQQQQQQQLIMEHELQRVSPPPGYRSSLDVSNLAAGIGNHLQLYGRGTPDGMAVCEAGAGIDLNAISACSSSSNCSSSYAENDGAIALQVMLPHDCTLPTPTKLGNTAALNMQKALNAQSCCSLQRAEVENMWNAAAAALAVRGGGSSSSNCAPSPTAAQGGTELAMLNETVITPAPMLGTIRKTRGPLYANDKGKGKGKGKGHGGGSSSSCSHVGGGLLSGPRVPMHECNRRYLNQNYYRRGCPLCGKFRYEDDTALCASIESGLDNLLVAHTHTMATTTVTTTTAAALTANERLNVARHVANNDDRRHCYGDGDNERCICCNVVVFGAGGGADAVGGADADADVGVAANPMSAAAAAAEQAPIIANKIPVLAIVHGNNNNTNNNSNNNSNTNTSNNIDDTNGNSNNKNNQNNNDNENENENENEHEKKQQQQPGQQEQQQEINVSHNATGEDLNANAAIAPRPAGGLMDAAELITEAAATGSNRSNRNNNNNNNNSFNSIDDNGIINLDMSKIIDKTGLPTYEGALKLESSGYV